MTAVTVRQKIDRGVKRRCAACATLFYDLLHYPIQCPKCGAAFKASTRTGLPSSAAKRFKAAALRTSPKAAPAAAAAAAAVVKLDKPKRRKAKSEDAEAEDRSDQDDLILDREDEDA